MIKYKYNKNDTFAKSFYKLQKLKTIQNQDKYNIVLQIINDLFDLKKKYTSLLQFKNIPEHLILTNIDHKIDIIHKYDKIVVDKLNSGKLTTKTKNSEYFVIFFIRRILSAIDYKLIGRTINDTKYYSIKN